jgi:D-amino peptidase
MKPIAFAPFVLAASLASAQPAPGSSAPPAKKVYVSVDMEGISGISGDDQLSAGGAEYGRSRRLMVEDANAAIRGALEAGATDVLVNDSHGGQRNLLPEDLHPRARLISHSFKRHGMMEGLDETFDAVIFIGYHTKAGTGAGLFAHTGSGVVRDLEINGKSVGEAGMNAALAAWHGVPVVLVTGDDAAVRQAQETAPGAAGVAVKRAINTRAVELKPLAQARAEIQAAAKAAVATARRGAPVRSPEYAVRMRFNTVVIPEIATAFEGIARPEPDVVTFTRKTMPEAYRLIRVLYRFIDAS